MSAIVIPTHGRVTRQITLQNLPVELHASTVLVASLKEEAAALKKMYPKVKVLTAPVDSIAQKRHWIMKNIKGHVIQLDDDLTFSARCAMRDRTWDGQGWKGTNGPFLAKATSTQIQEGFARVFELLEQGWGMVGLSPRLNNNRVEAATSCPARVMYAFGVNGDLYRQHKLNFAELECREDFNIALRMLRNGHAVGTLNELAVDQRAFGAEGGASSERTMERSNAEAERLAELHPGLVRLTRKEYVSSIPRVEVVVSWRKAMEEGLCK